MALIRSRMSLARSGRAPFQNVVVVSAFAGVCSPACWCILKQGLFDLGFSKIIILLIQRDSRVSSNLSPEFICGRHHSSSCGGSRELRIMHCDAHALS